MRANAIRSKVLLLLSVVCMIDFWTISIFRYFKKREQNSPPAEGEAPTQVARIRSTVRQKVNNQKDFYPYAFVKT